MNSTKTTTGSQNPDCTPWRDDLKAYLDGELAAGERTQLDHHLSTCPVCQEELEIMREIQRELRADEDAADSRISAALRSRIMDAAAGLPAEKDSGMLNSPAKMSPARLPWMNRALMYGGTLMAVVVVIAGILTTHGAPSAGLYSADSGGSPPPESAGPAAPPAAAGGSVASSVPQSSAKSSQAPRAESRYARHLDGSNYAFIDGHVKWLQSNAAPDGKAAAAGGGFTFGDASPAAGDTRLNSESAPAGDTSGVAAFDRDVHRSARLAVTVNDAENGSDSVEQIIQTAGGYVENNSLSTGANGLRSATLELKVPVTQFQSAIRQISALGTLRDKSIESQDITEQSAAAQARAQVMNRELAVGEARLSETLNRAKKKRNLDTWEVRQEVRELRAQEAEARARRDYLRKLANFSDLSVTLTEKQALVKPAGFWQSSGQSLREAWAAAQVSLKIPMQALIWILAYAPFWIPVFLLWRKYGRRPAE